MPRALNARFRRAHRVVVPLAAAPLLLTAASGSLYSLLLEQRSSSHAAAADVKGAARSLGTALKPVETQGTSSARALCLCGGLWCQRVQGPTSGGRGLLGDYGMVTFQLGVV